ncbi:MAG: hypothetical protein JEZ03_01395 [Bacteroidales bacterium]|nr:hypothetical protein [Bacteroidales bacterium]
MEQNKFRVFKYGGFAGVFFANNATAMFYNGAGDNSVSRILLVPEIRDNIEVELNRTYELGEMPKKMKYNPSNCLGFYGSYFLNEKNAINVDIGFTRLKSSSVFRLDYTNLPPDHLTDDTYFMGEIYGEEKRYLIDFGYQHFWAVGNKIDFYAEAGITFSNVEVIASKIKIGNLEYNIKTNYTNPNAIQQYGDVKQGQVGMGAYAVAGLEYQFNPSISIEPVLKVYYSQNRLPDFDEMYFHFAPSIRIAFKAMFEVIREE